MEEEIKVLVPQTQQPAVGVDLNPLNTSNRFLNTKESQNPDLQKKFYEPISDFVNGKKIDRMSLIQSKVNTNSINASLSYFSSKINQFEKMIVEFKTFLEESKRKLEEKFPSRNQGGVDPELFRKAADRAVIMQVQRSKLLANKFKDQKLLTEYTQNYVRLASELETLENFLSVKDTVEGGQIESMEKQLANLKKAVEKDLQSTVYKEKDERLILKDEKADLKAEDLLKIYKFESTSEIKVDTPVITGEVRAENQDLKPLLNLLDSAQNTVNLDLKLTRMSPQGLMDLVIRLNSFTTFENATYIFSWCDKLNIEIIRVLAYHLSMQKQMNCLKLSFEGADQLTDEGVLELASNLIALKKVDCLTLDFICCNSITPKGFDIILKYLDKIPGLAALSLAFRMCKNFDNEAVLAFSEVKALTKLEDLSIDVSDCKALNDKSLTSIGTFIGKSTNLSSFNLNFKNCSLITDKGIASFVKEVEPLKSLKEIQLVLANCSLLTNASILSLAPLVEKHTELQKLNLNLRMCKKINNKAVIDLSLKLPLTLVSLAINFYGCLNIDEDGIMQLIKSVGGLVKLKMLALNFSGLESMTNQCVYEFAKKFTNLKEVTRLNLNFERCDQISDSGLLDLAVVIRDFKLLDEVVINFRLCKKLTDDGIKQIAQKLCDLKDQRLLKVINLDFTFCKELTNQGVRGCVSQIGQIITLEELVLNFSGCPNLDDEAVIYSAFSLCELKNLKSFVLNFSGCKNITDKGVLDLASRFEKNILQSLYLNFSECDKITEKGKSAISALQDMIDKKAKARSPNASSFDI